MEVAKMPKFNDLSGLRFGRLTAKEVAQRSSRKGGNTKWLCVCDCGGSGVIYASNLISGQTKSCGCLHKEYLYKHGFTTHASVKPTYSCWKQMKDRCRNPKNKFFHYYGGRGIKVCEKWLNFEGFLADMGEKPEGLTLDRIDTNGDYEPNNCRWITQANQMRNTRRNINLTYKGITLTQAEWSRIFNVPWKTLSNRRKINGETIEESAEYFIKKGRWDGVVRISE